jgi:hypothetical protein
VRRLVLAALVLALAALPAGADAAPLLEDADAQELTQSLAEATEAQDVCYGYAVEVIDDSGEGPSGVERGSNQGPGQALDTAGCARWIQLTGTVLYTSEASDNEDSADAAVDARGFDVDLGDLEDLGFNAADLAGENGDVVLTNLVGALPVLAASRGAPPVEPELGTGTRAPNGDRPTGTIRPDWLGENFGLLILCLFAALGGLVWLLSTFRRSAT